MDGPFSNAAVYGKVFSLFWRSYIRRFPSPVRQYPLRVADSLPAGAAEFVQALNFDATARSMSLKSWYNIHRPTLEFDQERAA